MIVIDLSIVRINLNSLRITLVMCGWLFIFWLSRLLVVVCRIFFFFLFFELWHVGSSSLTRDQTWTPSGLHWECRALATGPPGKSHVWFSQFKGSDVNETEFKSTP